MMDLRRRLRLGALRPRREFVGPSTHKPMTVSFFGHFGSLNPGNESTLLAILSRLRTLSPQTRFRCICTNPEAAAARNRIDAVPITTRGARIWNRDAPLVRRVPMAVVGVGSEFREYGRAFRKLKGTDVLIVPGTGLLTDAYGLAAWGPYNLFKWTLMAKARRAKVLFVSVGAGPIRRVTGRVLVKAALSLADYRSYRDHASKECIRQIGFRAENDPIYPDLVFSLPDALLGRHHPPSDGSRRVVALGLMVYEGKYSAAHPLPETYTTYLESLAVFASWLLEHDYDIRLLLGDSDTSVINDFRSTLRKRLRAYDEARIIEEPIASVDDVLAELAATDIVVATRFHNVLLAMLLNKPVIAISFHHKCTALMDQMNLSDYCHDIAHMDANKLIEQFLWLEQNRGATQRTIGQGVEHAREELNEQYDLLFASA